MTIYYLPLAAGILAGVAGQILLKRGAAASTFAAQLFNPSTIIGLALYGGSAFTYMVALRHIPVSVAFPSVSISYALVAVVAHFMFGEPFGRRQIAGIALVMTGVLVINIA